MIQPGMAEALYMAARLRYLEERGDLLPKVPELRILKEYGVDPRLIPQLYPDIYTDKNGTLFARHKDFDNGDYANQRREIVYIPNNTNEWLIYAQRSLLRTVVFGTERTSLTYPVEALTLRIAQDGRVNLTMMSQTSAADGTNIASLIFPHHPAELPVNYADDFVKNGSMVTLEELMCRPFPGRLSHDAERLQAAEGLLKTWNFPLIEAAQQANHIVRNILLSPSHFGATHSVLRGAGIDH